MLRLYSANRMMQKKPENKKTALQTHQPFVPSAIHL